MSNKENEDFEALKARIEASGDYQLLRRVPAAPPVGADDGSPTYTVAVLDIETSGLEVETDRIIELAVRRIRITEDGRLFEIGEERSWLEDPERPLPQKISQLTGLRDEELAGQRIDDRMATAILRSADLIVAHNASFDRPFIERRFPQIVGAAWACTCNDIDWSELGFEGRSLSHLLFQMGLFFEGHRAAADVAALITMLVHRLKDGRTVFQVLVEWARRQTVRVDAVEAPYDASKALRARGYRWNPGRRCWCREVEEHALDTETSWLDLAVYFGKGTASYERVTWHERHG